MELMERVKAECERNTICKTCKFVKISGGCSLPYHPVDWDIEAIRKALGETSDKASDKEEIVVPEKWDDCYGFVITPALAIKQNEIINCLEQIKERMK